MLVRVTHNFRVDAAGLEEAIALAAHTAAEHLGKRALQSDFALELEKAGAEYHAVATFAADADVADALRIIDLRKG